jgi:hypothetical protein
VSKEKIQKIVRYTIIGSPLVGAALANQLPISDVAHQFMVLIALLWFQSIVLFEAFHPGSNL